MMKLRMGVAGMALAAAAVLLAQVPVEPDIALVEAGNTVGIVYRGPESTDPGRYVEHWILFKGYVTPESKMLTTLDAVPGAGPHFESERDFFARAAFPEGSRYVRAECEEFTRLPGRSR